MAAHDLGAAAGEVRDAARASCCSPKCSSGSVIRGEESEPGQAPGKGEEGESSALCPCGQPRLMVCHVATMGSMTFSFAAVVYLIAVAPCRQVHMQKRDARLYQYAEWPARPVRRLKGAMFANPPPISSYSKDALSVRQHATRELAPGTASRPRSFRRVGGRPSSCSCLPTA